MYELYGYLITKSPIKMVRKMVLPAVPDIGNINIRGEVVYEVLITSPRYPSAENKHPYGFIHAEAKNNSKELNVRIFVLYNSQFVSISMNE